MKKSYDDDIDSARSAAMRDSAKRFLWDLEDQGASPSTPKSPRATSRRAGLGSTYKRSQKADNQGLEGLGLKYHDAAYSDEAEESISRPNSSPPSWCGIRNICLVLLFAALIVASTHLYNRNNQGSGSASQQPPTSPVKYGTENTVRFVAMRARLTREGVTRDKMFDEVGSPQRTALLWLANQDFAQLNVDHDGLVQRYVLAVFYFMTYGQTLSDDVVTLPPAGWVNAQYWLSEKSVCQWHGIECEAWRMDNDDKHQYKVLEIDLPKNSLKGNLPSELGALTLLKLVDFSKNQLSGQIPTSILTMKDLRFIFLRANKFQGPLPGDWQGESVLRELHLGENNIDGSIPEEFNKVATLSALALDSNKLVGTLPDFSALANLKILYLDKNRLTGSVPSSYGKLSMLEDLRVTGNNLEGSMPSEVCDISSLKLLYVDCDKITCSCCQKCD